MSETVVYDLESIEVEKKNCKFEIGIGLRLVHRPLKVSHELSSIRQVGERIVLCIMKKLFFGTTARCDIAADTLNTDRLVVLIDQPRT